MNLRRVSAATLFLLAVSAPGFGAEIYDLVLSGGRVMDPASGLDAPRQVGIRGGKIAAISESPLVGRSSVSAAGLVVAPGFIDLHQHGFKPGDLRLKAQDGVTTALELEIGVFPVPAWLDSLAGRSPVNFGATVSHPGARFYAFNPTAKLPPQSSFSSVAGGLPAAGAREIAAMLAGLRQGLDDGALGVGFGINYTPAASREEIERMFRAAAERRVPVFVHTRAFGQAAIEETLRSAERAGTSLHLVHVGSSAGRDMPRVLPLLDAARRRGLDVTTEVYPYTAASARIESAMFDPGWQQNLRIDYGDVVWPATGERLTKESFDRYRAQRGHVIMHMMTEENIARAIIHPGVIIASDSVPFVEGKGHPRGAGSFARVLGHYVRERKLLPLMEALAKMTILPARRLEHVPTMRAKGRIAVGADADLTVFDPASIIDRATFATPTEPSAGVAHVLVGGVFVVRDGAIVEGAMPGRAVRIPAGAGRN